MELEIDKAKEQLAYQQMLNEQLIFLPSEPHSLQKLLNFVSKKNEQRYGKPEFTFISSKYDRNLAVAATPGLGPDELALFALKHFKKNEVIATYEGKNWGIVNRRNITNKILTKQNSGDYLWEIERNGKRMLIDCAVTGTIARFANDSCNNNAYAIVRDNVIHYIASKDINIFDEITVNYGGANFFTPENPRVKYTSQPLTNLLAKLYQLKYNETISCDFIKDRESMQIMLNLLDWNLFTNKMQGHMSTATARHEGELALPQERSTDKNYFYLDNNKPLIFDLNKADDRNFLKTINNVDFQKTSNFHFFVAPTGHIEGKKKYSLFTSEMIKKNTQLCRIEGEKLTNKEVNKTKLDENLLFVFDNFSIYCKNVGSEALFIQGALYEKDANVKIVLKNNIPYYEVKKDIPPGSEILAYFGENYYFGTDKILHFGNVVNDFNKTQMQWDGHLKYHITDQQYSLVLQNKTEQKVNTDAALKLEFKATKSKMQISNFIAPKNEERDPTAKKKAIFPNSKKPTKRGFVFTQLFPIDTEERYPKRQKI